MKYVPTQVAVTEQYLNVGMTVEGPGWIRFGLVKIPLGMLRDSGVVQAMDAAARRALIETWSEVDLADPLF